MIPLNDLKSHPSEIASVCPPRQRKADIHRQRLREIKCSIDSRDPRRPPKGNSKGARLEEERNAQIMCAPLHAHARRDARTRARHTHGRLWSPAVVEC